MSLLRCLKASWRNRTQCKRPKRHKLTQRWVPRLRRVRQVISSIWRSVSIPAQALTVGLKVLEPCLCRVSAMCAQSLVGAQLADNAQRPVTACTRGHAGCQPRCKYEQWKSSKAATKPQSCAPLHVQRAQPNVCPRQTLQALACSHELGQVQVHRPTAKASVVHTGIHYAIPVDREAYFCCASTVATTLFLPFPTLWLSCLIGAPVAHGPNIHRFHASMICISSVHSAL